MSELQQDSLARIERYQRLKAEAVQSGNTTLARKWPREIAEEQKFLAMVIRVEALNASGVLEGYMEKFRESRRSRDLVAI